MIPKTQPIRSNKLRESARGRPCTIRLPCCTGGGEDSVLCHLPYGGRGIGRKAPDTHAVIGCWRCHDIVDHRERSRLDDHVIYDALLRAHAETMQFWVDEGLITVAGAK